MPASARADVERDEQLRRARVARTRGDHGGRVTALQLAVHASQGRIRAQVARRVPAGAVEDVAATAVLRAVESIARNCPRTDTPPGFAAWLRRIVARTIADHWRRGGAHDHANVSWDGLVDRDGVVTGGRPADAFDVVHARGALHDALDAVPACHRAALYRYVVLDRPAPEVCGARLTHANVYKAAERYRGRLRDLLEGDA